MGRGIKDPSDFQVFLYGIIQIFLTWGEEGSVIILTFSDKRKAGAVFRQNLADVICERSPGVCGRTKAKLACLMGEQDESTIWGVYVSCEVTQLRGNIDCNLSSSYFGRHFHI